MEGKLKVCRGHEQMVIRFTFGYTISARSRRRRDRLAFGFTTTYAIIAYHQFEPQL